MQAREKAIKIKKNQTNKLKAGKKNEMKKRMENKEGKISGEQER